MLMNAALTLTQNHFSKLFEQFHRSLTISGFFFLRAWLPFPSLPAEPPTFLLGAGDAGNLCFYQQQQLTASPAPALCPWLMSCKAEAKAIASPPARGRRGIGSVIPPHSQ